MKSEAQQKKLKTVQRFLYRPRSIHICQKGPWKSHETLPLRIPTMWTKWYRIHITRQEPSLKLQHFCTFTFIFSTSIGETASPDTRKDRAGMWRIKDGRVSNRKHNQWENLVQFLVCRLRSLCKSLDFHILDINNVPGPYCAASTNLLQCWAVRTSEVRALDHLVNNIAKNSWDQI